MKWEWLKLLYFGLVKCNPINDYEKIIINKTVDNNWFKIVKPVKLIYPNNYSYQRKLFVLFSYKFDYSASRHFLAPTRKEDHW